MLDSLSSLIVSGLQKILSFFPDSPFSVLHDMGVASKYADLLAMINWFIPIYSFVSIMELWLAGIAIYYVWQIVLRWAKAIE